MNIARLTLRSRGKLGLALLAAVLLLAGCAGKSPAERKVEAAVKRYGVVATGMTQQELIAKLGEPARREGDRWRWETVADAQNQAALEVRFDGVNKVASVATTRVRND